MESSGPSVSVRAAAARLAARAVRLKSSAEAESTTDLSMKKVLGAFDLLLLGVGGVVGGGDCLTLESVHTGAHVPSPP